MSDLEFLIEAAHLAKKCPQSYRAYAVGALLVIDNKVISAGYSRELTATNHAEEACLQKVMHLNLSRATLYSSLEPCSHRASSSTSCTELIIQSGIKRVVFGVTESSLFVDTPIGGLLLKEANIETIQLEGIAEIFEEVNQHLKLPPPQNL